MTQNIAHEMRYEAGSSRYRILTLYVQNPKAEKPGFTIRTCQSPKGNMDTEKFLNMFGTCVDLFSGVGNEHWYRDFSKDQARTFVRNWRTNCGTSGLDKVVSFDGNYHKIEKLEVGEPLSLPKEFKEEPKPAPFQYVVTGERSAPEIYPGFAPMSFDASIVAVVTFEGERDLYSVDPDNVKQGEDEILRYYRDGYDREPESVVLYRRFSSLGGQS